LASGSFHAGGAVKSAEIHRAWTIAALQNGDEVYVSLTSLNLQPCDFCFME
jgi:hypothetical protein